MQLSGLCTSCNTTRVLNRVIVHHPAVTVWGGGSGGGFRANITNVRASGHHKSTTPSRSGHPAQIALGRGVTQTPSRTLPERNAASPSPDVMDGAAGMDGSGGGEG